MNGKPRLAVISLVLPFPRQSGQQQRVYNKLMALQERFEVTFITAVPERRKEVIQKRLVELCNEAFVLTVPDLEVPVVKVWHALRGALYAIVTGLKRSNYWAAKVAFSSEQLHLLKNIDPFDIVVFEYWHAFQAVPFFQQSGACCILDMHDLLWESYTRQLDSAWSPASVRTWRVSRYRQHEEAAWNVFDGLITINTAEHAYVQTKLPSKKLFYAPMGIDMCEWPYSWQPANPPRIGYYGSLGSPHNQRDALLCYERIMPGIWDRFPEAELWLVGSKPPASLCDLVHLDSRVHVTGFVEDVAAVLNTLSLVLCPWQGRYGFRSRLIEVMALGVPVITTTDAVYGMDFEADKGIWFRDTAQEMADLTLQLLSNREQLAKCSLAARQQVVGKYSYESSYRKLASALMDYSQITPV